MLCALLQIVTTPDLKIFSMFINLKRVYQFILYKSVNVKEYQIEIYGKANCHDSYISNSMSNAYVFSNFLTRTYPQYL